MGLVASLVAAVVLTSRVAEAQEAGGIGPGFAEPEPEPTPPTASARPVEPPPPPPAPTTATRGEDGIGVRAVGSAGASRLLNLSFTGWSGAVAVGGEARRGVEVYVGLSYGQARTSNGLGLYESTLDVTITAALRPVHLGLGGGFVYMQIPRISEDSSITRGGVGIHGWASVDLVRPTPRQALFIALRPEADWVRPQQLLRVTLGLGYRL